VLLGELRLNSQAIHRKTALVLLVVVGIARAAEPQCAISGRVTDQQGVPTQAATVTVVRVGALELGQEGPAGGATTDGSGRYCLKGLRPGGYVLRVIVRTHPPSASPACSECCSASSEFVPSGYGGMQEQNSGQTVWVERGRTASTATVVLQRAPAYCVPGEVRDAKGTLREDVRIALHGVGWSASVLNEGGRFLLTNLLPGEYRLVIRESGAYQRELARELIRVSGKSARIVVSLR